MFNTNNTTGCSTCISRAVCKYSEDYNKLLSEIENTIDKHGSMPFAFSLSCKHRREDNIPQVNLR